MKEHIIKIGNLEIGNNLPLTLIAGPCQMESREHALQCADYLTKLTSKLGLKFIYKSSFDKANRISKTGKRGIGMELALPIFEEIKTKYNCPVLTDIHSVEQVSKVATVADVLQIPAFLCRQTDLLLAAGNTGKIINVKKGQFLAPWDIKNVAEKIASTGNHNILLTERGVSFGYNRLINDMRAIPIMKETGYPVVFDATHSIQLPGGRGNASGGEPQYLKTVSTAACAIGVAALFVETHPDPINAPSDADCMLPFDELEDFCKLMMAFDKLAKKV